MADRAASEVTALLQAWSAGDATARDRLIPLIYADLRRRAAQLVRREGHSLTIGTTGLVHEAYLRLVEQRGVQFEGRSQFFAVATKVMRRILVDRARRRKAQKRGGREVKVALAEELVPSEPREVDLIALDQALDELAAVDSDQARLVELRFFGGLSIDEAAEVLDVSAATVSREWRTARAWLFRRLEVA